MAKNIQMQYFNGSSYEVCYPQVLMTNVTGILPIANGGTGNNSGLAATATKLATARTIRTNLASTSTASFDGSGNITPGITGTLSIANGGTGQTTAPKSLYALTNGSTALAATGLATGDYIPLADVSVLLVKKLLLRIQQLFLKQMAEWLKLRLVVIRVLALQATLTTRIQVE